MTLMQIYNKQKNLEKKRKKDEITLIVSIIICDCLTLMKWMKKYIFVNLTSSYDLLRSFDLLRLRMVVFKLEAKRYVIC